MLALYTLAQKSQLMSLGSFTRVMSEAMDPTAIASLAPGNVFSVSHTAGRYPRFNVAQCGDKRVFDVLEEVMRSRSNPRSRQSC
jgi:hypothetical protein